VIAALWSGPVRRRRAFLKDMQGLLSMCDANARSPAGINPVGLLCRRQRASQGMECPSPAAAPRRVNDACPPSVALLLR